MPVKILMPALSPTMEEGNLAKWLVKEGDSVASGDVIAEIETDKATMEVESIDEGILAKIFVEEGTTGVKVNSVIAALLEDGEDESALEGLDFDTVPQASSADGSTPGSQVTPPNSQVTPVAAVSSAETGQPQMAPQRDVISEIPEGTDMISMTVREALRDAMAEEMRANDDVFVMGEEVAEYQGAYKVTQGLLDEFGARRVVDTPITEHGFAGLGAGAAMAGLQPIIEFMTFNFAMQAIDHIINSAAKTLYMSGGQMGCPIVFRGPNGAAARVGAQHSQDYAAWYASVPGLKVVMPYDAADAKGLLKSAIRDPNPVIFLENEILYGKTFDVPKLDDWTVPIGKAKHVRAGDDVTLVSWGIGMNYTLEAADELAKQGIEADILDLRTLRPLDMDAVIRSVQKTHRCVVIEEAWPQCSMSSEISARLMEEAFDWLDAPVIRVTGKDVPMPYAENLEKLALPSVQDVINAAKSVAYKD